MFFACLALVICSDPLLLPPFPPPSDYAIVGGAAGRPHTSRRIPVTELATEILRVQRDMTTVASAEEEDVAPQAKEPIYVRVVRPTGPTYTFVDLPGYQEAEEVNGRLVENVVNKQIESYLNAPNFIIMAILPVTDVFENVEVSMISASHFASSLHFSRLPLLLI